ncbi:flavodoxin-dependent (E)-4-hydroxy-3-methylbut-2-enyl-diphosphate synthase, partial [Planctomycetota bacterium]
GNPVIVQSMTNTFTHEIDKTVEQIHGLEKAGCEIIRCAVPDDRAAEALPEIISGINIPLVADIHFRADLAVKAAEAGAAKIRINPGNIGSDEKVLSVIHAAKDRGIPIRIGVNSGSVDKEILKRYGHPTPEAMTESMMKFIVFFEKENFKDLILSVKSTSVRDTVEANRMLSSETKYPLHLGITEAGTRLYGTVKSAVGLGILLFEGIGDTIRVSLSGNPIHEIEAAQNILKAAGIRRFGPEIITCPTCGRTNIDIEPIALEIEQKTRDFQNINTIAVMGCEVNGPGEACEADLGVACGKETATLFISGKPVRKIKADNIVNELLKEIESRF